ncbi:hypothetical protein F3Y22_tig00110160pilonHSYRG00659 [Hibiscus syriacus]|uniref:Retrotransposon gag domain-containing protein n=1 Tax=Hibiscus syriacus TaxID=106335 RepID=A0A6A3BHY5_HIBSY|nr:hypothetical protein F3Y22_tig00110160pilonHSYRG00659 [Hibiscus syriacus]
MAANEGNMKIEKLDGALKTFLEGLRTGTMLKGEQGDAQRLLEAIVVAGKLTELVGDGKESSWNGQDEPSTVRSQGKPSGKNDKANSGSKKKVSKEKLKYYFCDSPHRISGCPEKRRLATIMKRMEEGEVAKVGVGTSVKAAKPGKRFGSIEGVNAAKQGTRRGKSVDVEAAKPKRKPDAISSVQAIKSGGRLGEATCSRVAESRAKDGATTSSQVVNPRSRCDETAGVKAVKMEAWSRLMRLRHKWTLKEYVSRFRRFMLKVSSLTKEDGFFTFMFGLKPWAKKILELREVKELSKALTTVESIKEFGVKKNNTSKAKSKANGSGKRFCDEGKSKDEECCSSSGRESPLNDEPDGGSVLQNYPRGVESSKVMDEPKIELSREEDEPWIEEALRVGSIRVISAKASRSQVQEELSVSKEFVEHVRVENMASETILREGLKEINRLFPNIKISPYKDDEEEQDLEHSHPAVRGKEVEKIAISGDKRKCVSQAIAHGVTMNQVAPTDWLDLDLEKANGQQSDTQQLNEAGDASDMVLQDYINYLTGAIEGLPVPPEFLFQIGDFRYQKRTLMIKD